MKFTCIINLDGEPMREIQALRVALQQVVDGLADCTSLVDAQRETRVYDADGMAVGNWQVSA